MTIALDSTGDLFTVWPRDTEVRYSHSEDGGATWTAAAQLPAQAGNPIKGSLLNESNDTAAVIAFQSKVGVMWSDHSGTSAADQGYYFAVLDAGSDPTVGGDWSLEKLPTLVVNAPGEVADNHINMKTTSDGRVFMVGKTGKDTLNCATNQSQPLIEFFQRTASGTWSTHLVGTVGDCNTRPQLQISEELETAYVFLTSPNGGGVVYRKSAPLTGPEAFKFRGAADTTIQKGTPFIQSATETQIDDASTTKQVVSSATGIVVLASNIANTGKYYFHNTLTLPASDSTAPSGSVTIAGGAALTKTASVSVAVTATDAGSGVSLVRLSDSSAVNGSGVLEQRHDVRIHHAHQLDHGGGRRHEDGLRPVARQRRQLVDTGQRHHRPRCHGAVGHRHHQRRGRRDRDGLRDAEPDRRRWLGERRHPRPHLEHRGLRWGYPDRLRGQQTLDPGCRRRDEDRVRQVRRRGGQHLRVGRQ